MNNFNELTNTSEFAQDNGGTFLVVFLIIWILSIVASWKIFTKAGEKGWKSIIPIYSTYILYKICWEIRFFWITFGLGAVLTLIGNINAPGMLLSLITLIVAIAILYFAAKFYSKFAKSFGKGTGFAVGLFFLPTIFQLILGFGSAEYTKAE